MAADLPDVLYIVGTGSNWSNNELRYSLRSVAALLPHRKVFIVGHCPAWVEGVVHLDANDIHGPAKLANSCHKLKVALSCPDLGPNVVLMNDDFFFLNQYFDLAPQNRGFLLDSLRTHPTHGGYYAEAMRQMYAELVLMGHLRPLDYGLHIPFLFQTRLAREVVDKFSHLPQGGFLFRTAYGNYVGLGGETVSDVKAKGPRWTEPSIAASFLSTDAEVVLNPRFQAWIDRKFPSPCRYEKPGPVLEHPHRGS